MKRVLVTGGAGFIGSHLCTELLSRGDEVICLDSFISSSPKNIDRFLKNKNFHLISQDVQDPIKLNGIDEIYNLACPASPVQYQLNPIDTILTCVKGSINVLELARKTGAKVLQASTSEVYGDPSVNPQREDYWGNVCTIGARACYDEGKRCAETLFYNYQKQYKLSIRIARIFNTYGPNMLMHDGRVVSNFIVQALKNEDLTIYGEGRQTRSFQYVDDLIKGFLSLMETNYMGPVNLGNPNEITVAELAERVLRLIPESNSKVVIRPLPENDPCVRCPDISLACSLMDWKPQVDLNIGLNKTIEYFRTVVKVKQPAVIKSATNPAYINIK